MPVVRLLPGEKQRDRVLTHEQEVECLDAASGVLSVFAAIAIDTGMRPSEITAMRWENVKLTPVGSARYGHIHIPDGKTARARRSLPMTDRVQALLDVRFEEMDEPRWVWVFPSFDDPKRPTTHNTMKCAHDRVIRGLTSKIEPFTLYTLRHTALTRLGEVNVDAFTIQKIAGQSSILVSQRYVHPTGERVEAPFPASERITPLRRKVHRRRPEPGGGHRNGHSRKPAVPIPLLSLLK